MKESYIEGLLAEGVKRLGGISYKMISTVNGVPDRLVLYKGKLIFVELKAKAGKLSEIQKVRHTEMESHGGIIYVVYGKEGVDDFVGCLSKIYG